MEKLTKGQERTLKRVAFGFSHMFGAQVNIIVKDKKTSRDGVQKFDFGVEVIGKVSEQKQIVISEFVADFFDNYLAWLMEIDEKEEEKITYV